MKKKKEEVNTTPVNNDEMSDELMKTLLVDLSKTRYYQAIVRFYNSIEANAIHSLSSVDPFKDPTEVARTQGIRIGLHYLYQTIEEEVEKRKKIELGNKEDVSVPTYNT